MQFWRTFSVFLKGKFEEKLFTKDIFLEDKNRLKIKRFGNVLAEEHSINECLNKVWN